MEAWNHSFSIGEFNPNSLTYHSATKGENKSGIINTTKKKSRTECLQSQEPVQTSNLNDYV